MKAKGLVAAFGITVVCMLIAGVLLPLPWIARESIFEFTARTPRAKDPAQPPESANEGGEQR
ncbi:MAG: hypothetical protein AB9869_10245 [Verrucomicrobiia bacterium]